MPTKIAKPIYNGDEWKDDADDADADAMDFRPMMLA
jgi:hypothetical protein